MSCNRLSYQCKQQVVRDSFNLAEFVDYYNVGNTPCPSANSPRDLEKGSRKELVLIRIKKHASDIKLKKAGKTSIHNKLLQLIRSQSVIKDTTKEPRYPCEDKTTDNNCSVSNSDVMRRQSFHHTTRSMWKPPLKSNLQKQKSPFLSGHRIALSEINIQDKSLPKLATKKPSGNGARLNYTGLRSRRYPKHMQLNVGDLTPWDLQSIQ